MSFRKGQITYLFYLKVALVFSGLLNSLSANPLIIEGAGQLENPFNPGDHVFGMQSTSMGLAVDIGSSTQFYNAGRNSAVSLRLPIAICPDGGVVGLPLRADTNHIISKVGGVGSNFSAPPQFSDPTLRVTALGVQPDGKILVGMTSAFFRLNSDGSIDSSFSVGGASLIGPVKSILITLDNRIVVATTGNIQRFMTNGAPDTTFSVSRFQFGDCNSAAFQPNGKILAVGTFDHVNNIPLGGVVRFDAGGNVDFSFPQLGSGFTSIGVQDDGAFVVGTPGDVTRYFSDGKRDISFAPPRGRQETVYAGIDPSGRVYFNDLVNGLETVFQYSGHSRIVIPSAGISTVLQHSGSVGGAWTTVKALTAGNASDFLLPEQNFVGNEFFRLQPAQ